AQAEPFVVVMYGHGQDFLGPLLADHVLIEFVFDGARRRNVGDQTLVHAAAALLLVDDGLAQLDALAADIHVAGPLDERADVAVALAAKGAEGVAIAAGIAGGAAAAVAWAHIFRRHALSFTASPHRDSRAAYELSGFYA